MSYQPPEPPISAPSQPRTGRSIKAPLPVVTYSILALTILVYGLQMLTQTGRGYDLMLVYGAMIADQIQQGEFWRLLTPALLHFSLIHIGANMYSLFILGPVLEQFFGRKRFLALYILSALGGNVLSFYMNTNAIAAGASTAIFGLIAAQGAFIYINRRLFGDRSRPMLQNIVFMIILNLGIGLSMGFDNWGHLGGLITGLAFTWFAGPQLEEETKATGGFGVVDRHSGSIPWVASIVIASILVGLAFVRIVTH